MGTVDRVLPWRRAAPPTAEELGPLLNAFKNRHPKKPTAMILRAYDMAAQAHANQWRESGEKYILHPLAVAIIVANLGLDDVAVSAALLHDAVEDSELTVAEVHQAFGPDVAAIVDGVTKLDRLQFDSKEAQQAATIHKRHPDADEALKKGDVTVLNDWRRTNIWSKASTLTTPDLIVAATGEPLSARHFIAHVQQRYG